MSVDLRGVIAEKLGQHLPHHPGDKVTVTVHIRLVLETVFDIGALVAGHAFGHDADTTFQGAALAGIKAVGNADHRRCVEDQIMFIGGRRGGEPGVQFMGKILHGGIAFDDTYKAFGERLLLRKRHMLVIFNGVRDAAEQIGIADHAGEGRGELRDGQGKGPGDALQDMVLIGFIRAGRRRVCLFPHQPGFNGV